MFSRALHHVVSDGRSDFQNTNFPKGHRFRKWTIEEVRKEIEEGIKIEEALDGDWS